MFAIAQPYNARKNGSIVERLRTEMSDESARALESEIKLAAFEQILCAYTRLMLFVPQLGPAVINRP